MPANSKQKWQEYESITKYIYEALGAKYGIKVKGYGSSCKVKGKSGVLHQVDVLTEQYNGNQCLQTAIECKYWKNKVNKEVIMKFSELLNDTDIANGIIVCKSGFTKDTQTYAEHLGIKLVELREVDENDEEFKKDVNIATLNLSTKINGTRSIITCLDFGEVQIVNQIEVYQFYQATLYNSLGESKPFSTYLRSFNKQIENKREFLKKNSIDFPLDQPYTLKSANRVINISKISITGFLTKINESHNFSFGVVDQVWLIMNELFNKKRIALSKNGLIWTLS